MPPDAETLIAKIQALPAERLAEIEDFGDFVAAKARRLEASTRPTARRRSGPGSGRRTTNDGRGHHRRTGSGADRAVAADVDDDQVIAAAVVAEADFLISGDRHLLVLRRHGNVRIVAPAEAIRLLLHGSN